MNTLSPDHFHLMNNQYTYSGKGFLSGLSMTLDAMLAPGRKTDSVVKTLKSDPKIEDIYHWRNQSRRPVRNKGKSLDFGLKLACRFSETWKHPMGLGVLFMLR
jgi:hypothetical protein